MTSGDPETAATKMKKIPLSVAPIMIAMSIALAIAGCANESRQATGRSAQQKLFRNMHLNDRSLAGVMIFQFPGSPEDDIGYTEDSHPSSVRYFFWDGRSRYVQHSPRGDVIAEKWWEPDHHLLEDPEFWANVDFTHGSPPANPKYLKRWRAATQD